MKELKIIADAGGTKTDWAVLFPDSTYEVFQTPGINAIVSSADKIEEVINSFFRHYLEITNKARLTTPIKNSLFYYGAGCGSERNKEKLKRIISKSTSNLFSDIVINTDLLGSARALFGQNKGLIGIIGTGSGSGLYDGKEMLESIPSLGYILGDEASGAYFGKKLLNSYFKKSLSKEFSDKFEAAYKLELPEVLRKVYQDKNVNSYLARFARFLVDNISEKDSEKMILEGINEFFIRNINKYAINKKEVSLGFMGSLSFALRNQITEVAANYGYQSPVFLKDPIENLVKYHQNLKNEKSD